MCLQGGHVQVSEELGQGFEVSTCVNQAGFKLHRQQDFACEWIEVIVLVHTHHKSVALIPDVEVKRGLLGPASAGRIRPLSAFFSVLVIRHLAFQKVLQQRFCYYPRVDRFG